MLKQSNAPSSLNCWKLKCFKTFELIHFLKQIKTFKFKIQFHWCLESLNIKTLNLNKIWKTFLVKKYFELFETKHCVFTFEKTIHVYSKLHQFWTVGFTFWIKHNKSYFAWSSWDSPSKEINWKIKETYQRIIMK